jgi:uncharacterized SAM-binding protein YcdF (DUF218 family)
MFFVLSKVLEFFIHPLHLVLLLLVGTLVADWLGAVRLRRAGLITAVVFLVVIGVSWVPDALMRPLEDRFPQPSLTGLYPTGAIVLSGAVGTGAVARTRETSTLNDRAERMTKAVELARRYPEMRIVFTGFSGSLAPEGPSEADVARRFFEEQGIDPARIVYEDRARNTFENAIFSKELAGPQRGETWLLVTSAFHMPRSVGIFRRVGWDVLPYPVDFHTPIGLGRFWFDVASESLDLDLAMHEWIGLLAYRLTGRTSSLFPGPEAYPGTEERPSFSRV